MGINIIMKKIAFSGILSLLLGYTAWGTNISDLSMVGCAPNIRTTSESSTSIVTKDSHLYEQLGPTLALMKMFLREDFKPLPSGLKDNVQAFFSSEKYNPHDCMAAEMQRIEYDDELGGILCDLIRNEQEQAKKGNVTLYHGLSGEMFFIYRYLAEFFSALTDQDLGKFIFRGDHLYAKNPTNGKIFQNMREIQEFYRSGYFGKIDNSYGIGDYRRGIDKMTMHCNIALSASPNTSKTTASSVGFMCQSFSVNEHKIFDIVCSAFVLQGMSIIDARRSAAEVEDFCNNIFAVQNKKNGGIFAISMPKEVSDNLALHVMSGGLQYDLSYIKLLNELKAFFQASGEYQKVLYSLRSYTSDTLISDWAETIKNAFGAMDLSVEKKQELEKILQSFLDSRVSNGTSISYLLECLQNAVSHSQSDEDIRNLTNEISLYLHPLVKMDIQGFLRHPMSTDTQTEFDLKLRKLASAHANLILSSRMKPIDGAFLIPRHSAISESAEYQIDAIPFLIGLGKLEEVKKIAIQNPRFYENATIRKLLIGKALQGLGEGFKSILDYVEQICEKSFFSLLPPEHLDLFINIAIKKDKYQVLDHLFKFGISEQMLVNMLSSIFHANFIYCSGGNYLIYCSEGNYLDKMLETQPLSQTAMENIILHGDPAILVAESIISFIKHGFSFNPNETKGKEHLNAWLEICKKHQHLASSIIDIIEHYKLTYENAKDLYVFVTNEQIQSYHFDDGSSKVDYEMLENSYKVKIGELEVIVPFTDLDKFFIAPYSYEDKSRIAEHLSQRFGRVYDIDLISAFVSLQYSIKRNGYVFVSLGVPENYKWLAELKNVKTLDEAKQLVYELDDLNILLQNLHLLDNLPEVQEQAESRFMSFSFGKIANFNYLKTTREHIVNEWFEKILKEYKTISEKSDIIHDYSAAADKKRSVFHDMLHQQGLPLSIATGIITDGYDYEFYFDLNDVLVILSRMWKYNPSGFLLFNREQIQKNSSFFNEFLENEMNLHPELIKDKEFVFKLFQIQPLPQSILNDKRKLKELFFMLNAHEQRIILFENNNLKELAKEVQYPGTSFSIGEVESILADYGLQFFDYFVL